MNKLKCLFTFLLSLAFINNIFAKEGDAPAYVKVTNNSKYTIDNVKFIVLKKDDLFWPKGESVSPALKPGQVWEQTYNRRKERSPYAGGGYYSENETPINIVTVSIACQKGSSSELTRAKNVRVNNVVVTISNHPNRSDAVKVDITSRNTSTGAREESTSFDLTISAPSQEKKITNNLVATKDFNAHATATISRKGAADEEIVLYPNSTTTIKQYAICPIESIKLQDNYGCFFKTNWDSLPTVLNRQILKEGPLDRPPFGAPVKCPLKEE